MYILVIIVTLGGFQNEPVKKQYPTRKACDSIKVQLETETQKLRSKYLEASYECVPAV